MKTLTLTTEQLKRRQRRQNLTARVMFTFAMPLACVAAAIAAAVTPLSRSTAIGWPLIAGCASLAAGTANRTAANWFRRHIRHIERCSDHGLIAAEADASMAAARPTP